jgi:metallo-beta-lactamase family protein
MNVLSFYGAAGCVTGACMLLEAQKSRVLVECGMFQGTKTLKQLNYGEFPFDAASLDAVLLTHAHIDHSGLLPKLRLAGFEGPVFATAGTRDLCEVLLPDAGSIQEIEVSQLNRRNRRRGGADLTPIFTSADARDTLAQFQTVHLKEWVGVARGVRARWWNAGHILGAASIEVELKDEANEAPLRLCFSGDVGPGDRDLADDPDGPSDIDHLIVESTYGGTERKEFDTATRRKILRDELRTAHAAGGPLLIPAFAVERTQELLVDLLALMESTEAPPGQIFLDSPLAIKATDVFLRSGHRDSGHNPFKSLRESRLLRFTESAAESREIERQRGWHVIIAASGMCDAGRVRGHLRRLLPREEATVLIVGYQAFGTLGRFLLEGRRDVRIQGDEIAVRASIREIDVYSGHADASGLARWVQARRPISGTVFLNHGEPDSLTGLKSRLATDGLPADRITIAALDQSYRLERNAPAISTAPTPPRLTPEALTLLDWHNQRVSFLAAMQEKLNRAPDDKARERLLRLLDEALARV